MFDILIRNGEIIDGSKAERFRADVGVKDGRIHTIGNLEGATAVQTIDASGKIVAPGFIDVHAHADGWLLKKSHLESKTRQGFTTELIMADGLSYAPLSPEMSYEWIHYQRALNGLQFDDYSGWQTLEEYMALLDQTNVQNSLPHIPYANLRIMACGYGRAVPDDTQMRHILAEVEKGMDAGAVGLSTGLDYVTQSFATTDELVEVSQKVAQLGGIYVTHVRYKKGTLNGVKEAVEIGKRANIPVHISHLKGADAAEAEAILRYIDKVAVNEVEFTFDVYPYISSSTMMNYLLPYEVWEDGPFQVIPKLMQPEIRARFMAGLRFVDVERAQIAWVQSKANAKYQGYTLMEYAEAVTLPLVDALCHLLIEENLAVLLVFFIEGDEFVEPFLQHDCFMLGTDGIYHEDGMLHPRQFGSVGRFLGRLVRDKGIMDLETAVHKLTHFPAQRFGLTQRGLVNEGYYADLVLFDPNTIIDHATNERPHQYTEGVTDLIVNGTAVILDGTAVAFGDGVPLPGRALKFNTS